MEVLVFCLFGFCLFHWGIVALQCRDGFCYTSDSAECIHISPLSRTSSRTPFIPPTQVITEHQAELPAPCGRRSLQLSVLHRVVCVCISLPSPSSSHPRQRTGLISSSFCPFQPYLLSC